MRTEAGLSGLWRVGGDSWNGAVPALSAQGDANVYLLRSRGVGGLIDCGTFAGLPQIEANINEVGIEPRELCDLLLTHSHWDHTQAASEWQARRELRTHLNATGASFLARGDHRLVGYHMHGPEYDFIPFAVDHAVQDGETFELAGTALTAHFLPGHTPDSTLYTLAQADLRVGICGDIVFAPNAHGESAIGLLSSLWLSDLDTYVESLQRLVATPLDVLLPGHGPVVAGHEHVKDAIHAGLMTAEKLAADPTVRTNLGV